jgi:hypothetical protein
MTVSEVLEAAADWIETHGKCERAFRHGEKRCAYGALLEVDSEPPLADVAAAQLRVRVGPVIAWSDRHSAREVVVTMRTVAHEVGGRRHD